MYIIAIFIFMRVYARMYVTTGKLIDNRKYIILVTTNRHIHICYSKLGVLLYVVLKQMAVLQFEYVHT